MGVEHRWFFIHFSEAVNRLHRISCVILYQTWAWENVAGNSLGL